MPSETTRMQSGEGWVKVKLLSNNRQNSALVKFTNYFLFIATISLVLQLSILTLLLASFVLNRKKKFRIHGLLMLFAVVFHIGLILTIMVPSFVIALIPMVLAAPTGTISILSTVHAAAGTFTAAIGVWIVTSWRLRQSLQYCAPKKKAMVATFIIWLVSIALGISLYLFFYWTSLFG
jgi:hypothetical protein